MSLFAKLVTVVALLCPLAQGDDEVSLIQSSGKVTKADAKQEGSTAGKEKFDHWDFISNIVNNGPDQDVSAGQTFTQDPLYSQLSSIGSEAQTMQLDSSKVAQELAGADAQKFAGAEGQKLAHDMMLKKVLDKYYEKARKSAVDVPSSVSSSARSVSVPESTRLRSGADPSTLYSTSSESALSDAKIEAVVQDALSNVEDRDDGEDDEDEQGDMKPAKSHKKLSQKALLKKILHTQEMLMKKVNKRDDGDSNEVEHDMLDDQRFDKGKNKKVDLFSSSVEAEKAVFQADVLADKQSFDHYDRENANQYAKHMKQKEAAAVTYINAQNVMEDTAQNAEMAEFYAMNNPLQAGMYGGMMD